MCNLNILFNNDIKYLIYELVTKDIRFTGGRGTGIQQRQLGAIPDCVPQVLSKSLFVSRYMC